MTSDHVYEVGEFVWAKIGKYPWWPSIVVSPEDVTEDVRKAKKKNTTLVRFFADTQFGWMARKEIRPFRGENFKKWSKTKNSDVRKALEEAFKVEKESGFIPEEEGEKEDEKKNEKEDKDDASKGTKE